MTKPKKILNDPASSVSEFIEGLLLQYPHHMVKLQNHNVILAAENIARCSASTGNNPVVQLISGGGSGHEPSHAGWLGSGMLSGAVCGGIFASPSVASVLAAIRAVASPAGVLLIVKNYTGDRLNFGMAVEKANLEGSSTSCQMVVVSDDCALPRTKGITGARGVAGTVLVHKIAGAAAAKGKSLDEVAALAKLANRRMGSLGVTLNSVTVPGAEQVNDRLDEKTIEIGLGIHGEAGLRQSPMLTADEIAKEMVGTIHSHGRIKEGGTEDEIVPLFQAGDEVCVLVNNLGGTSNFEMSILARSCVKLLESDEYGAKASRVMVGSFMTSFDMHGVSLTILNLAGQSELKALLDAPTTAPAWSTCDIWKSGETRPSATELPEVVVDEKGMDKKQNLPKVTLTTFGTHAKTLLLSASNKLSEAEPLLTKYDTIVGDGDCGITMKRGATEVEKRVNDGTISTEHPVTMFAGIADGVSASMGGTSGVLLELMFRKMASTLARDSAIGVPELCKAVQAGVDAVSLYGGAKVGSRTMLDALVPGAATLASELSLAAAAAKARQGANGTASMKSASAGRSNYLSQETLEGTPDPGAVAVAIVLEALAAGVA